MPRTTARRPARALALLSCGTLAVAALTACSDEGAEEATSAPGTAGPTAATAEPTAAKPATVTWDHPQVDGYVVSEEAPLETMIQLENEELACALQLAHQVIPDAGIDDSTYTDTAIENAKEPLGEVTETAREDSAIPSDAGQLAAREVSLTTTSGSQDMDIKMLLRVSSADQVLVSIVQICPAGSLDEAAWDSFVAGSTVHGTTATEF